MTKAKARQRAKANAAKKADKRAAAKRPGSEFRPGQFDPGSSSIKGPSARAGIKTIGGARRGAARSR